MPHTKSTCPIPNCRRCQRLDFIASRNQARFVLDVPPVKPKAVKSAVPKPKPIVKPAEPKKPKPKLYRALKNEHGSGWKSEPVDYDGRGIVYFHITEEEAISWTNRKNAEAVKCK